jgi:hypothetical protein
MLSTDNCLFAYFVIADYFPSSRRGSKRAKEGNHWYVLSMNMQARRFEALDSMRGEGNMSLTAHANLLVSRIKQI